MRPSKRPSEPEEEPSRYPLRIVFLACFVLLALTVLVGKLWHEQVDRRQHWMKKVKTGSTVTVRIPSVRGDIRDCQGVVLAGNRSTYGVDFDLPAIVKSYQTIEKKAPPMINYRKKIDGMPKDQQIEDIVTILNETVIRKLLELGIARDDPAVRLAFSATDVEKHYRTNERVPFQYLFNVSFDTVAKLSENNLGVNGVDIVLRAERQYHFAALGAHLLGAVGNIRDISKEPDIDAFTYYQPDIVGVSSLERAYDKYLRGKPGKRVLERSPMNRIGKELEDQYVPPQPGNHVYLTIDARIQTIVENALREAVVGRASAVVVNPNNGDIVAMASIPSYDPNIFNGITDAEMKRLDDDETDPLINRSINSYVPGSTFKLVTALAAELSGFSADRRFTCNGFVTFGGRAMDCHIYRSGHGSHGSLNMQEAIKKSCNCYFYNLANSIMEGDHRVGLSYIEKIGTALGLGVRSDLPLSREMPGILPGPQWLTAQGRATEIEHMGNIANTSIGQGMVEASPLQMAMVAATLGNGGTSYYPRLVSRVVTSDLEDVRDADGNFVVPVEPRVRANLRDLGLTAAQIEVVRKGMWRVVNEAGGTGRQAEIKGIGVAGKTGTAQFVRLTEDGTKVADNRVWFICFAPYKNPKYAICVMVEGAKSGGGVAAPIVQKILRESLALEAGVEPKVVPLAPVEGNFTQVDSVGIKPDGRLSHLVEAAFKRPPDEDEVSVDNGEVRVEKRNRERAMPKPAGRTAPDARGEAVAGRVQPPPPKGSFLKNLFGPRKPPAPAPAPVPLNQRR